MWNGPMRPFEANEQAYYTPEPLATHIADLARRVAGPVPRVFVDVGVGLGALYTRLPDPKLGVELMTTLPQLEGVHYGVDVLEWTPPDWTHEHVVVVCNPPFRKQVAILNRCASFECASLSVVWIAGMSVRHWDNEDRIDPHMHLLHEWLTPPEWSTFSTPTGPKKVRTVVQVWRRSPALRTLYKDLSYPLSLAFATSREGNVVVTRVNSAARVGSAGLLGRDVFYADNVAVLTPQGKQSVGALGPTTDRLGTVHLEHGGAKGSALCLQCDRHDELVASIQAHRQSGIFRDLLLYRHTSSGFVTLSCKMLRRMLSDGWRQLARPVEYIDGVRRAAAQW